MKGGRVLDSYSLGLDFSFSTNDLKLNMLVAGSTGTGKTNLVMRLIRETSGEVNYWVFDQKRNT